MRDNRTYFPVLLCVPHNGDGRQLWDQLLRGHPRSGGNNFYDKLDTKMKKDKSKYWWWILQAAVARGTVVPWLGNSDALMQVKSLLFCNSFPINLPGCGSSGSDHHAAQLVPSLRTRQQDQGELGTHRHDDHGSDAIINYLRTYIDRL